MFFCLDALPCVRRCSCWVLPVRGGSFCFFAQTHFLACEGVVAGSQQSGGNHFFARTHFLVCEDVVDGSQQSGGRIVILFPDALPCVRRCSSWVPAVRGRIIFFCEIRWPVRWVPADRWRNNYFARNKEALPCGCRGPSCQPLHVQSTSDGSRSLTMLTTPRRED